MDLVPNVCLDGVFIFQNLMATASNATTPTSPLDCFHVRTVILAQVVSTASTVMSPLVCASDVKLVMVSQPKTVLAPNVLIPSSSVMVLMSAPHALRVLEVLAASSAIPPLKMVTACCVNWSGEQMLPLVSVITVSMRLGAQVTLLARPVLWLRAAGIAVTRLECVLHALLASTFKEMVALFVLMAPGNHRRPSLPLAQHAQALQSTAPIVMS